MNSEKYIGLDVHPSNDLGSGLGFGRQAADGIDLGDERGDDSAVRRGTTGLYDLLKPHVAQLVVCNPRKIALLKAGNKSDRIDARKLAELLRGDLLKPVYHGENGVRTLRVLARVYLTTVKDRTRVMSRLKAVYRSLAIPCAGRDVYYARHRAKWLGKIPHAGPRRRAEQLPVIGISCTRRNKPTAVGFFVR